MNTYGLLFFVVLILSGPTVTGQSFDQEVLRLINEARTQPQQFAIDYQEIIGRKSSEFLAYLQTADPIHPVGTNDSLNYYAFQLQKGELSPRFSRSWGFCGRSSSVYSGFYPEKPVKLILNNFNNVINPNYTHIGIIYEEETMGFAIVWSRKCSTPKVRKEFLFEGLIDTSKVDENKIQTAKNVDYLIDLEKVMIREINFARCYPAIYADIVAKDMAEDSPLSFDDYRAGVELLNELRTMKPLHALQPHPCLYESARRHGKDQEEHKFVGHIGSDGSDPDDRISEACDQLERGDENLSCGNWGNPRTNVINLLIDSGISSRGHRYNLMDFGWKFVGCYFSKKTGRYNGCWVQNFGS